MATEDHSGHAGLTYAMGGGAHSSQVLTNASLSAALQAFASADRIFFADLNELNNSNAEGGALLMLKGSQLTVITAARGVEADQVHPQHIHGFADARDAMVPTLAQDDDRDGFIELAEGLDTYGPILLNLTSPAGSGLSGFPNPSGDSFLFSQTYDLNDARNGEMAKLLDDVSLDRREIVLHGSTVATGHGGGTIGEIDGTAGYKAVLPIASGEIAELSYANALVQFQSAVSLRLGRTADGTDGNDHLMGRKGSETLLGRSGDDVIRGGRGDDFLSGGAGRDFLAGQQDDDYLDGGAGKDELFGGAGNDYLFGGAGSDALFGAKGHDHLYGGAGSDRAFFNITRDGGDTVDLGAGSDTVDVTASGPTQVRLTFTSAEVGNGQVNDSGTLANQDGGLAVRMQAEDGSDALSGQISRFDDEGMTFVAGSAGVTFDVRDLVSGVARGDQFEVVSLGAAKDDALSALQRDKAYYFNAGAGDDRIIGGRDNDFLVGGGGNDVLRGRAGDDKFISGGGNDILSGGRGDDVFIFNTPLNASTNVDRIQDFNAGSDTVQLDDVVFTGLAAGALVAGAFALSSSTAEADDRVVYDQSTGNLFFDSNGGTRDNLVQFAKLDNNVTVTANDFFVI